MGCGCKKRMAALEQKAPRVAKAIKPAHNAAMKVMDRLSAKPKPRTRRLVGGSGA